MTAPETFPLRAPGDELPLQLRRWAPTGAEAVGSVVILHGMGEHGGRYVPFAEALAAAGLWVWVPDLRGHGASPGPGGLGDLGAGGWEALLADVTALVQLAAEHRPGLPVVLFGHSMGSLAAQCFAVERSRLLDGLVLAGSTCFDQLPPPAEGEDPLAAFNAAFAPARTPWDWLSRDPERVDAYAADPVCGTSLTPEGLAGLRASAERLADPALLRRIRNDLPVRLDAGDADPLNDGGRLLTELAERWREAGVRELELHLWPGARHELLQETNRDEISAELVRWISGVCLRHPG
ncbi:MAG: alpha/beta fold hydrolase [Pseudomonadales bacterium]|nr:alpha/beta fold hydrolase [Pseudomonadales bacterium]